MNLSRAHRLLTPVAMVAMLHLAGSLADAATIAYSVSPRDNTLRTIDATNGTTLSSVPITLSGQSVLAGLGLARHPATGELWALLRLVGQAGRQLVKIDPATGIATTVGNTGGAF